MSQSQTRLPDPLTPDGCDMGRNDWYPLYFDRLRNSKWWRRATDLCRARNVMLWGEAYKQVPAGSLPDDDDELAEAAGYGFDVAAFQQAKAEIMHPWVMCSDGRWYHPTLCEVVLEAWERVSDRRKAERIKKANQRATVRAKRAGTLPKLTPVPDIPPPVPRDNPPVPGDTPHNQAGHAAQDRTGQDRTEQLEATPPVASAPPPATGRAPKSDPWDGDEHFRMLWDTCTTQMRRRAKSRANVWPEWVRARKVDEPATILGGMGVYLISDPDVQRTGGPGLHIWLKNRTWQGYSKGGDVASIGSDWSDETWRRYLDGCASGVATWDARLGPPPGQPCCRVPAHLLQPQNGMGELNSAA